MTQQPAQKRGFGCLGYGCIIGVAIIVVTIGGIFWLARSAMRGAVERFTTEQPVALPTIVMDEGTKESLTRTVDAFKRTIQDPQASGEFILSQSELNGILASTHFSGMVLIELQRDSVSTNFSFPLKTLGEWESARPIIGDLLNRYVAGTARAKVGIINGVVSVTLTSLVLNGQVFDGDALKEASEWVTGSLNSESNADTLNKRERIQLARIENGAVVVTVTPAK